MAYNVSTLSGTVTWSDSTLFDGYAVLVLAFPMNYTFATIVNQKPTQPISDRLKVGIKQGVYDQGARVIQNASLDPPNTRYCAFYFDTNGNNLGHTALFTIATSPYTIAQPTLTLPVATTSIPAIANPGAVGASLGTTYHDEIPVGAVDGINAVFTISTTPVLLLLNVNGVIQNLGVDYSISGATITFINVPAIASILRAVYFT